MFLNTTCIFKTAKMEKREITAGIKNAIEHGSSLEQAKQSFANAGYNPQDVEDSSSSLSGAISYNASIQVPNPEIPKPMFQIQENKSNILIIALIIILISLILGLLATVFMKDAIASIINSISP